jgi:hypothetical protein
MDQRSNLRIGPHRQAGWPRVLTAARLERADRVAAHLADPVTEHLAWERVRAGTADTADFLAVMDLGLWRQHLLGSAPLLATREAIVRPPQHLGVPTLLHNMCRVIAYPPSQQLPAEVADALELGQALARDPRLLRGIFSADEGAATVCRTLALGDDVNAVVARSRTWQPSQSGWVISDAATQLSQQLSPRLDARLARAVLGVDLCRVTDPAMIEQLTYGQLGAILRARGASAFDVQPGWSIPVKFRQAPTSE